MIAVVLVLAAVVVSAPMAAALLVSVASRREDAAWSLGKPPRSWLEAAARRVVAFDADSIDWPRSKAQHLADASAREVIRDAADSAAEAGTRSALPLP